jgi:hypothetical protein
MRCAIQSKPYQVDNCCSTKSIFERKERQARKGVQKINLWEALIFPKGGLQSYTVKHTIISIAPAMQRGRIIAFAGCHRAAKYDQATVGKAGMAVLQSLPPHVNALW